MMATSRKPEIMADAAYAILTRTGCELTGKFLIDDEVLRDSGVTDMDQYSCVPGLHNCSSACRFVFITVQMVKTTLCIKVGKL